MKKYFKTFFIVLFLLVTGALIFTFKILYKKNQILKKCNNELWVTKSAAAKMEENFSYNILSDDRKVNDIILLNSDNHEIYLSSLIKDETLIYRFYETTCNSCVEADLVILNQLKDIIAPNKIIVIGSFTKAKDIRLFSELYSIKNQIYSSIESFNIIADRDTLERKAFFFLLDKKFKTHFPYVTNPGHSINSPYFKRVIEYFKDSNFKEHS